MVPTKISSPSGKMPILICLSRSGRGMFGSRLIESLHAIYRATRKRIRELPVTGEHASAAATRCLYKLDGESSASDLDRGRKSDCSCSLHHQIRHCRHHQSAAYIYQIRDSDLSSAVRLCQILRQILDRYWLDSALSTSMLAGTNCRNYHLPAMPKSSLCNGISAGSAWTRNAPDSCHSSLLLLLAAGPGT